MVGGHRPGASYRRRRPMTADGPVSAGVDVRETGSEVRCSMSSDSCHREIISAMPAADPRVDQIDL